MADKVSELEQRRNLAEQAKARRAAAGLLAAGKGLSLKGLTIRQLINDGRRW